MVATLTMKSRSVGSFHMPLTGRWVIGVTWMSCRASMRCGHIETQAFEEGVRRELRELARPTKFVAGSGTGVP
jgi:hypothetical protein